MILTYIDLLGDGQRHQIDAEITTDHSASSYGQPVVVLAGGALLDAASWTLLNYQIEQADEQEYDLLRRWISNMSFLTGGHQMTIAEALDYAERTGHEISARGLRKAAERGDIRGAGKLGRDWIIPQNGLDDYLQNRPKPGPVGRL